MVLASVDTLDGTRGHAAVQQASASYCKGVHPYIDDLLMPHQDMYNTKVPTPNQCTSTMLKEPHLHSFGYLFQWAHPNTKEHHLSIIS